MNVLVALKWAWAWAGRKPKTAIFAVAAIPASVTLALVPDVHVVLRVIYGLGSYVMLIAAFEEAS